MVSNQFLLPLRVWPKTANWGASQFLDRENDPRPWVHADVGLRESAALAPFPLVIVGRQCPDLAPTILVRFARWSDVFFLCPVLDKVRDPASVFGDVMPLLLFVLLGGWF